jgi:hypothetical protein
MEDIGTKDDRAPAQQVFILSGMPRGMGDSTENRKEPSVFVGLGNLIASRNTTTLAQIYEILPDQISPA